jgi:hypothetical protein
LSLRASAQWKPDGGHVFDTAHLQAEMASHLLDYSGHPSGWFAVDWFDPAYIQGQTAGNGTGFIGVPSARVLGHNWYSAGIHGYQVKFSYGLFNHLEAGLSKDFNHEIGSVQDLANSTHLHGRLQILSQEGQGLDLAAGFENIGLEAAGFGRGLAFNSFVNATPASQPQVYYLAAGRTVPAWPSAMVTGGVKRGPETNDVLGFCNLSQILFPGCLAQGEYDGEGMNLGFRFLLSSELKMDLALFHVEYIDTSQQGYFGKFLAEHVLFGVSYAEEVQWGLLPGF